jgi:uncharacterized protein
LSGSLCWRGKAPERAKPYEPLVGNVPTSKNIVWTGVSEKAAGLMDARHFPIEFALIFPFVGAAAGILVSMLLGFDQGDALLFTVLCASASYIAVPAVMKTAVPEANPGLYLPMALGLTFPLNILIGIPLYHAAIQHLIPKGRPPA